MMATPEMRIALERSANDFIDRESKRADCGLRADENLKKFGTPFPVMELLNLPVDAAVAAVGQTLNGPLQPVEITARPYEGRLDRWQVTIKVL